MLIPVDVPSHQRIWIDLALRHTVYANSATSFHKYVINHAHVRGTYTDEQISCRIRRSFAGMLREDVPRDMAILELSEVYGIPQMCITSIINGNGDLKVAAGEPTTTYGELA